MLCCSLRDGVHDACCATNEEFQMYRCAACGTPTAQFAMRLGRCLECAPKPIVVNFDDATLDVGDGNPYEVAHGTLDAAERWAKRLLENPH